MHQKPRLVRDATGRHKLEVSLSGGQYQLTLEDRAINVLMDDLDCDIRDAVPEAFVPFFVATGDAWFPREKDTDSIIEDLRSGTSLKDNKREALIDYISGALIPERNEDRVRRVIDDSPIAETIDPDELNINSLPEIPNWSELSDTEDHVDSTANTARNAVENDSNQTKYTETSTAEELEKVPGIGPERAESLLEAGITSISELAEKHPVEVSAIDGFSEGIAAVGVEGAREFIGQKIPASERLSNDTGRDADVFKPILNQLAAAGVPASEAEDTLCVLYGPTIVDMDSVLGDQAYFLWESGYRTPSDLVESSIDELTDVYRVGETTAAQIREEAKDFIKNP